MRNIYSERIHPTETNGIDRRHVELSARHQNQN
jgi:hypothetical protein